METKHVIIVLLGSKFVKAQSLCNSSIAIVVCENRNFTQVQESILPLEKIIRRGRFQLVEFVTVHHVPLRL